MPQSAVRMRGLVAVRIQWLALSRPFWPSLSARHKQPPFPSESRKGHKRLGLKTTYRTREADKNGMVQNTGAKQCHSGRRYPNPEVRARTIMGCLAVDGPSHNIIPVSLQADRGFAAVTDETIYSVEDRRPMQPARLVYRAGVAVWMQRWPQEGVSSRQLLLYVGPFDMGLSHNTSYIAVEPIARPYQ